MKAQTRDVLTMLELAGHMGVTNGQFANAGILSYTSRIAELRKMGYSITQTRQGNAGTRRYTLAGYPITAITGVQTTMEVSR